MRIIWSQEIFWIVTVIQEKIFKKKRDGKRQGDEVNIFLARESIICGGRGTGNGTDIKRGHHTGTYAVRCGSRMNGIEKNKRDKWALAQDDN